MLDVQVAGDNVNIVFSKDMLSKEALNELIDGLRLKYLVSKSQLKEDDAMKLANELKSNWWKNNRERFLAKIK